MDEHVLERGRKVRDARAIGKSVAGADNKAVARSNHVADGHADGVADAASNVSSHDKGAVGIAKRAAHDRGANGGGRGGSEESRRGARGQQQGRERAHVARSTAAGCTAARPWKWPAPRSRRGS